MHPNGYRICRNAREVAEAIEVAVGPHGFGDCRVTVDGNDAIDVWYIGDEGECDAERADAAWEVVSTECRYVTARSGVNAGAGHYGPTVESWCHMRPLVRGAALHYPVAVVYADPSALMVTAARIDRARVALLGGA